MKTTNFLLLSLQLLTLSGNFIHLFLVHNCMYVINMGRNFCLHTHSFLWSGTNFKRLFYHFTLWKWFWENFRFQFYLELNASFQGYSIRSETWKIMCSNRCKEKGLVLLCIEKRTCNFLNLSTLFWPSKFEFYFVPKKEKILCEIICRVEKISQKFLQLLECSEYKITGFYGSRKSSGEPDPTEFEFQVSFLLHTWEASTHPKLKVGKSMNQKR